MFSRRHAGAVLCAAMLVACDQKADPITGPDVSANLIPIEDFLPGVPVLDPFAPDADNDNGVLESARGGAMTTFGGEQRTFAFTAKNRADGTQGQFQLVNRSTGFKQHGIVTCLEVVGNVAWVGGITTQTNNPAFEEIGAVWQVVDDGEGSDSQDQISFAFLAPQPWDQTCHDMVPRELNDVEEGNVQVQDAP